MHGLSLSLVAAIGIPTARQCLNVALPVVTVAAGWWLINRLDQIIEHLFPHWEWERKLGWLNIRAQRQADSVLRWTRYIFFALLAVALYGIVWGVQVLPLLADWEEPGVLAELGSHLPVLLISLGLWLLYLGTVLFPKLKYDHETEELEKFRATLGEDEKDNRVKRSERRLQTKPRLNRTIPRR